MDSIRDAVTAWHVWRTPGAVLRILREHGRSAIQAEWENLAATDRVRIDAVSSGLSDAGVSAWLLGDDAYPQSLAQLKSPPPVLFYAGNAALLGDPAVGVCGSRAASPEGLEAARALAQSVARRGHVIVAGNALGVDAEAQGGALSAGGGVITVLPEGVSHFRFRTGSTLPDYSESQLLVISQFPPTQPWSVGGAMTRNSLIASIAGVLVVIEAAESGGTFAAGEVALRMGRPVIALEFGAGTPAGNAALIRKGAWPARTRRELGTRLQEAESLTSAPVVRNAEQLPLTL